MTRNKKFIAGGVALVAIAAGAVAASAHRGMGGMGGPFGGHRGHGLMGAVCSGNGPEMADHILVSIEYKVKPTDAQKPAFEELKAAARAAAVKAKTACPPPPPAPQKAADGTTAAPTAPPKKTPVERLAMMEARLTAELEAVKTVRPAAEKFYASLTDEQKKALAGHDRGPGGWGHREGREGPGGPGGHWRHHRGGMDDGDMGGPPAGAPPPPAAKQ